MTLTYRDEIGRPLTSLEVDGNFRTLSDRIEFLADAESDPAPSDGKTYGRKNGDWTAIEPGLPEAPTDGQSYVRKSAAWAVAPASSGGTGNVRHRGLWDNTMDIKEFDVVEFNDMTWIARYDLGRTAVAPSFFSSGRWMAFGMPGSQTPEESSQRILHRFSTVSGRTGRLDVFSIINEYEDRLKNLEARIAALE